MLVLKRDRCRALLHVCYGCRHSRYGNGDVKGFEFDAGGRRIDILAQDKAGAFVALELKVSRGYDRVDGQLLRYVNWVRQNMAGPGQRVRGIIVFRMMSEDLRLACASIKDVELFEYQLSVTVTKVPALELPAALRPVCFSVIQLLERVTAQGRDGAVCVSKTGRSALGGPSGRCRRRPRTGSPGHYEKVPVMRSPRFASA